MSLRRKKLKMSQFVVVSTFRFYFRTFFLHIWIQIHCSCSGRSFVLQLFPGHVPGLFQDCRTVPDISRTYRAPLLLQICSLFFLFQTLESVRVCHPQRPCLPLCSLSPPGGAGLQYLRCSWSFLRCFSFCFSSLSRAFFSFSAALWISLMRRFRALRSDELSTPRPCNNTNNSVRCA